MLDRFFLIRMASRQRRAFKEFAERSSDEFGDSLLRLVLFGSVSRGEEGEGSDVDIFVVVSDEEQKERVYDLAAEVALKYGVHIAPVVRTEEEFERTRSTSFTEEVLRSGRAAV